MWLMAVEHLQLPLTPVGAVGLCSSTANQALSICARSSDLFLIKEILLWYKEVLEDLVRNQVCSIFNKNVWFSDVFQVLLCNQV